MSGRKRLGDEDRGHKVPAQGPEVFPPSTGKPQALLPVRDAQTDEPKLLRVRWPAGVPRDKKPWPPEPEVIDLANRTLSKRPLMADPYDTLPRESA